MAGGAIAAPPGASRSAQSSAIRLLVFYNSRESTVAGQEPEDLRHGANAPRHDEEACEESLNHKHVIFVLLSPPFPLGVVGAGRDAELVRIARR